MQLRKLPGVASPRMRARVKWVWTQIYKSYRVMQNKSRKTPWCLSCRLFTGLDLAVVIVLKIPRDLRKNFSKSLLSSKKIYE